MFAKSEQFDNTGRHPGRTEQEASLTASLFTAMKAHSLNTAGLDIWDMPRGGFERPHCTTECGITRTEVYIIRLPTRIGRFLG
jgi:hypothetical protein